MDLLKFQLRASTQIADRFNDYMADPLTITRTRIVPFYQNLSSITGSGKTLILADTVEQIRSRLPVEPIVLWLSKGRIVVWQTLSNLASGKYADLVGGFDVKPLLDANLSDVEDSSRALMLIATVGKINQKDKELGDRRIFKVGLDSADQSIWDMLKARKDTRGVRRPFIIVYDEGHNLSNQQTELLLDLNPDALIAASATLRVPQALDKIIARLRSDKSWRDADIVTAVKSADVVKTGLVKKQVMLCGYMTPMEIAINELFEDFRKAEEAVSRLSLNFDPKAIYVANTNVPDGGSVKEDISRPFHERQARPIVIWRHLVETLKIDPAQIALYCDLKFDSKFPPPKSFNLFSGGDADYDRFIAGKYRHIIFNLGLQEGWDDPSCCFCYIDKDMGSPDQITQVVGRVLRQPGARHYSTAVLNTAHFYIRTDEKGVFESILHEVRKKLIGEFPEIALTVSKNSRAGERPTKPVLKHREVPIASIDSSDAKAPIDEIVRMIPNYSGNSEDTIGAGGRIQVLQTIGKDGSTREEWIDFQHSNKVTARWVFLRQLQRRHRKAAHLCDIEHPKFDALIEYNSPAAALIREQADRVADAYIEHSTIVQNALDDPYIVEGILIDEATLVKFRHALHEGYSGLNELEKAFAAGLDKTKKIWCRNPSQGGYAIPLLDRGSTRTFNPDFLLWSDAKRVVAIDTKGDHLIVEDAGRKLFHIEPVSPGAQVVVRLVTEGHWTVASGTPSKTKGKNGYTVWNLKHGKLHPHLCDDAEAAARACLL